ncbi:MAG: 30S ribosomal protein S6 [Bacilli bacterium]|nr:30S ribosomal protein S6 [Bacilli bacterium]
MKQYTGMFIVIPNLTEEGYQAVIADITKIFVDNSSQVMEVKEWGMKDMAYEINDLRKGYYVVFTVDATPEAIAEYNRVCNIREDILRHIIVKD